MVSADLDQLVLEGIGKEAFPGDDCNLLQCGAGGG